jgi:hypothetical protein
MKADWLTCSNCKTKSPLVVFLYQLLVNGINPQLLVELVNVAKKQLEVIAPEEASLDVGGLAMIAQDIARVLTGEGAIQAEPVVCEEKAKTINISFDEAMDSFTLQLVTDNHSVTTQFSKALLNKLFKKLLESATKPEK